MRVRPVLHILLAGVMLAGLLQAQPAGALNLYQIHGRVADAIGRPLSGVTIRNGGQVTTTDANGEYSLGQSSTGAFSLRASRNDLDANTQAVTVTLPLDTRADFTMLYRTTVSVLDEFVSTADGSAALDLTVSSWAPAPGAPGAPDGASCVYVHDSRTDQDAPAIYNGNSAAPWEWTYSVTVPQQTTGGTHVLTAHVTDCESATQLAVPNSAGYTIDNVAPDIDPGRVFPLDQTVYSNQPISALVYDIGGVGIDASSIVVTVRDDTGSVADMLTGSEVAFDPATGYIFSSEVALSSTSRYDVEVQVADRAGNSSTYRQPRADGGAGFRLIDASYGQAQATIPDTACTLSDVNLSTGMKRATCDNVPLNIGASAVGLSASVLEGAGQVVHTASLASAMMKTTVAGVETAWQAYNANDPSWSPRTELMAFELAQPSDQPVTIPIAARTISLGTLEADVPATWQSATLSMPQSQQTLTTAAGTTCRNPGLVREDELCTPSPVVPGPGPYIVGEADLGVIEINADGTSSQIQAPSILETRYAADGSVTGTDWIPILGDVGSKNYGQATINARKCSKQGKDATSTWSKHYNWRTTHADVHRDIWTRNWNNSNYKNGQWHWTVALCSEGGIDARGGWRTEYQNIGSSIDSYYGWRVNYSAEKGSDKDYVDSQMSLKTSVELGPITIDAGLGSGKSGGWDHAPGSQWQGADDNWLDVRRHNAHVAWWVSSCPPIPFGCSSSRRGVSGFMATVQEVQWEIPYSVTSTITWGARESYEANDPQF